MRRIYPDNDMRRWEVYNNCCEILANADNYYTKAEIDSTIGEINTILDSI